MTIHSFTDPVFGVNSYVIEEGRRAVLIDPILTDDLCTLISALDVDFAVLTHEHYDHIRSVNELKEKFGVRFYCGEKTAAGLGDPKVNMSRYTTMLKQFLPFGDGLPVKVDDYVCSAEVTLADGQSIEWQGHTLTFYDTPGHSAGSVCILLDERILFSGDTVFSDYATATRMPGGNGRLFRSVTEPLLDRLGKDVVVYPGHSGSFALEKRFKNES